MIQIRAVTIVFVATLLFGAGWAIGELRHSNNTLRVQDTLKTCNDLALSTSALAEKSLNQTVACEETLRICMSHLGLHATNSQRIHQ